MLQERLLSLIVEIIRLNKCLKCNTKKFNFRFVKRINLFIVSEEKLKKDSLKSYLNVKNLTFRVVNGKRLVI
jgi:hypothetical protein